MSLSELRFLYQNKKYNELIEKSQKFLYAKYPYNILKEVFRLCKLALKEIPKKNRKVLYFSHNLNMEGAPLALLSLIEKKNSTKKSILISEKDGVIKTDLIRRNIEVYESPFKLDIYLNKEYYY